jgi:peptidoglycan hydrolase CwlO-like protein
MKTVSLLDTLTLRADISKLFEGQLALLRGGGKSNPDVLIKAQQQSLEHAKAELDTALKDREEFLRGFDARVGRWKDEVARAEADLKSLNEQATKIKKEEVKPSVSPRESKVAAKPSPDSRRKPAK